MEQVTWTNLLIIAAVLTLLMLILGSLWRLLKKFIQIWLVLMAILFILKIAADAGWF